MNWLDSADYIASNWMLRAASSARLPLYQGWLQILRFVVPIAIVLVMLHAIGLI